MSCMLHRPYLQAYVDQELSPERAIDVESHLRECEECAAEVELTRSVCRATRQTVTSVSMCPGFQSRLGACLAEERKRQEAKASSQLSWKVIAPLSAAAAVTLFVGVQYRRASEEAPVVRASSNNLVDVLVDYHNNSDEPDAVDPSTVAEMEPQLGFPIHAPDLNRFGARFVGADLVPIDHTTMAKLRYTIAGRRVTLYMYDAEKLPMRAQWALSPGVVGQRAVFTGNRRGYSIATSEQQGVGYAVTGDLSREESAELVAAVYP